MMHRPWDCAQPDEWLPQSLRLCWGGGGDGGGFSGDGGGWSGDGGGWSGDSGGSGWGDGGYGGATTGGGDWGSAGSADFSGSWAGGDTNAWAGTAYDASSFSSGTLGGGDWGSFGTASFPDSTPGAIFTDIAGPNPGVTTGGGDWGSAGQASFAGTGGGPGGVFSADSGVGTGSGFYGSSTGGGLFGDYGTGGGFTGIGGTYGTGTGTFGGFGSAGTSSGGRSGGPLGGSNMVSAAPSGGRAFADTVGGGTLTGQTSGRTSDAPTRSEAEVESAGPDVDTGRADADADPGAESVSDYGTPTTSEAAPEAEAGPSLSDAAPAGMIGGSRDAAPASAGQTAAPAQTSAFGPQSLNADYQGSPYASNYDQSAPSQAYQAAAQQLSGLTQSALSPDYGYDYSGSPYANMGPQAYQDALSTLSNLTQSSLTQSDQPDYQGSPYADMGPQGSRGNWGDLPGVYATGISNMWSDLQSSKAAQVAQDFINAHALNDPATWLSPTNQQTFNEIANLPNTLNPTNWVDINSLMGTPWGQQTTAFDLQAAGEQGRAGQQMELATQLGIDQIGANQTPSEFAPGQPGMTTFEGGPMSTGFTTFEGGPLSTGHTNFEGEPVSSTGHPNFFDANPFADMLPAGDPSYPTSPDTIFSPGAYPQDAPGYYATDTQPAAPTYDTTMESGPPGAPTTTDNAQTKGSDPALSGYPAAPGAAPLGQPGTPGTTPGAPPAAGGRTFVSEAAVGNVVNATDIAAQNLNVSSPVADAATQAAHNAMQSLASPAEVGAAVSAAALGKGATPEQADALGAAATAAAQSQTAFTPGQPGQQQQGQPGLAQPGAPVGPQAPTQTTPPPPSLIEQAQQQPGVPMPQSRPADAPPGLVDMAQPSVPTPQARPADAPTAPPPTTARVGPFVGIIDKGMSDQAEAAGQAANAGAGRAVPANPNTGMPSMSALNVPGGRNRASAPTTIVTHFTGGPGYTIGSLVSQMAKGGAGYNYAVDKDGKVYQLRPDERIAGHVGPGKGNTRGIKNANSIGVSAIAENESDLTPAQIAAMKDVVAALGRQFGISPSNVHGHAVVSPGRRGGGEGSTVAGWSHGLTSWNDAPTSRPPADIPNVRTAQPTIPLPGRRPADAPQVEIAQPQQTEPPEVPAARPSPTMPLPPAETPAPVAPVDRPPADIPVTLTPPQRGTPDPALLGRTATQIARDMAAKGPRPTSLAEGTAAAVGLARALAQAGIPTNIATQIITNVVKEGTRQAGYDPDGMLAGPAVKGVIGTALQGYQPAKPGEVQGPPSPFAPGKQGALPSGQQYADLSQSLGRAPADPGRFSEDYGREGDVGAASPYFGATTPTVPQLSPMIAPPPPSRGRPPAPPPPPQYTPGGPGMFNPFRGNEAALQPEAPSLLSFLQNFNPISTAEARSGRSQAGNLQAPRADPGTIQSRLSSQRSNVIDDLQTNQGLRNTLDLIVTGEVGSQGKAAVLGFLETAMNKVAAEASQQGRAPTGRDLLNYLNDRGYFPATWGKIESGKIKGGALTDDLLGAIAGGSNTTNLSTGNSSAKSEGSRFGGNPTNATIGREHYGVENYGHHAAWYNAMGAPEAGRGIGSDFAAQPGMPAIAISPAPTMPMRGLAKGGHVDKDEPVVVGEEGPEYFMPDRPGTVFPHMPQPGKGKNVDRWPKIPASEYPGRYGGVEREYEWQTREAQNPAPSLMDMVDSGQLRLTPNWRAMLNDPSLIALGRSRMDDRREGIDPGAEQYGAFIPAPEPAAEPPDPTSPLAQALGYGSIKRRPMQIGRQSY